MVRIAVIPILALLIAAPLAAQAPEGWQVRIDKSTNASDPDDVPEVKVATVAKGFRVTGGPAGTYWNEKNTAKGNFKVSGTFTLNKPSGHVNYYGLIFGGADLNGVNQRYTYFLVAQNGSYIIRQRMGEKVTDVVGRTQPHAAVRLPGEGGTSTNSLEVGVGATQVAFLVNGQVVHTAPRASVQADGIAGVRINHLLDVTVDSFQVTPQ